MGGYRRMGEWNILCLLWGFSFRFWLLIFVMCFGLTLSIDMRCVNRHARPLAARSGQQS